MKNKLPILIIGAGPIGLATAAHLSERGEKFIILEAGPRVADSVHEWSHVPMFSPWKYNIDSAAARILERYQWDRPDDNGIPTGGELISRFINPLAETFEIKSNIQLDSQVIAISRKRISKLRSHGRETAPFVVRYLHENIVKTLEARAIIDASGTWKTPRPAGADGLPAYGEGATRSNIWYGIPDILNKERDRYLSKDVAVIGGGHSAINSLLELTDLKKESEKMQLHWILTKANVEDAYGGLDNDELPGRGRVGQRIKELVDTGFVNVHTPFFVERIENVENQVKISGQSIIVNDEILVNEIIVATGFKPNLDMLREIRIAVDEQSESPVRLAPLIDPNIHSCGSVEPHGEEVLRHPEKDFYIVGMKSYGRAPTFLLATGYEQVRSVVAALVGDWEAAKEVHLKLPETGVCGVPRAVDPNNINFPSHEEASPETSCC